MQSLSSYVKLAAPAKAPKIEWPKPTATMSDSPQLFRYLNFMLAFAAPQDSEKTCWHALPRSVSRQVHRSRSTS